MPQTQIKLAKEGETYVVAAGRLLEDVLNNSEYKLAFMRILKYDAHGEQIIDDPNNIQAPAKKLLTMLFSKDTERAVDCLKFAIPISLN